MSLLNLLFKLRYAYVSSVIKSPFSLSNSSPSLCIFGRSCPPLLCLQLTHSYSSSHRNAFQNHPSFAKITISEISNAFIVSESHGTRTWLLDRMNATLISCGFQNMIASLSRSGSCTLFGPLRVAFVLLLLMLCSCSQPFLSPCLALAMSRPQQSCSLLAFVYK